MQQLYVCSSVYLRVPNHKQMFKNILSLFLLLFAFAVTSQSFAITEPTDKKLETDSTTIKSRQLINTSQEKPQVVASDKSTETKLSFWETEEEVEEDSSSDSALSFNFIYYIIEKFKFQVE